MRKLFSNMYWAPAPASSSTASEEQPVMELAKAKIAEAPRFDRDELMAEVEHLRAKRASLFGVEQAAKDQIDRRISECHALSEREVLREKLGNLPVIDPVVFSWRHPEMLKKERIMMPSLALLSLDSPEVRCVVDWHGEARWTPALPTFLEDVFRDVERAAARLIDTSHYNRDNVRFSATFTGVIPAATKTKIAETREHFDEVRLLTETPGWTKVMSEMPDPIVVGIAGDMLWVIDVFDPTPLEEYVASEFTS